MTDNEPSNAVLAEMIEALEERLKSRDDDETRFHLRMEEKMTNLSATVVTMQLAGAVSEAKLDARITAAGARMDTHDKYTQDREKESRFRTGAFIAAITAVGTVAAAAVAVAVALH